MGLTGLGKVVAQTIRQLGVGIRFVASKIGHYIHLAIRYLVRFVRLFYHYLARTYDSFRKDPLRFLQFAGSLAIMMYYGVL